MHLNQCGFQDAIQELSSESFISSVQASQDDHTPSPSNHKTLPYQSIDSYEEIKQKLAPKDPKKWCAAQKYLVELRRIPHPLIKKIHSEGKVYATKKGGIAFVHQDISGKEVGCSIRSIRHDSSFRQSLGDKKEGWFYLGDIHFAKTLYLCESPIDALSLYSLVKTKHSSAFVALSGAYTPTPLLEYALKKNMDIVPSFDSDAAGIRATQKLQEKWAQLTGKEEPLDIKVPLHKDWNEDLCAIKQQHQWTKAPSVGF